MMIFLRFDLVENIVWDIPRLCDGGMRSVCFIGVVRAIWTPSGDNALTRVLIVDWQNDRQGKEQNDGQVLDGVSEEGEECKGVESSRCKNFFSRDMIEYRNPTEE